MSLYVRQLQLGPMENFVYLVGNADRPETAVIDAAWDVPAILRACEEDGRKLTHALVSHRHHDHVNGLAPLLEQLNVPIHVNREDAAALEKSLGKDALHLVSGGDAIDVGGVRITCVHTPGHTAGSQCFHVSQDDGALFSGDTVFVNACGRCDLEGGDPAKMFDSLSHVIGALPGQTRLYPGHDYGDVPVSSIEREKQQNPYFRFGDVASFIAYRMRPRK